MPSPSRFGFWVALSIAATACAANSNAGPAPVPGTPIQTWQELDADGGARSVYFRNDGKLPATITALAIDRCENTRQTCGDVPSNQVIPPGKTVMVLRVERLDPKATWSFAYTYHTHIEGAPAVAEGAPAPGTVRLTMEHVAAGSVQQISVEEFQPAVAAETKGGICAVVHFSDLPEGHKALMMMFGSPPNPARRVLVRYDANGAAYDYSDTRKNSSDPSGLATVISLDLVRQTGMLRNQTGDQPPVWFRVTGATLLTAESLGRPSELIARIWKECR